MCGFLAILSSDKRVRAKADVAIQMLYHRGLTGKEYRGISHNKEHILFHTSLPIVSRKQSEYIQPQFIRGDENRPMVFAGEIFNFKDIERTLNNFDVSRPPDEFRTDIDLVNYALSASLQGFSSLALMFDGFWSMAKVENGGLMAVTDHLAIKPVYYRTDMDAVCSEPLPLTALGKTSKDHIFESNTYKWGYDITGRTPWLEIKQLKPGHILVDGSERPYWDWDNVFDPTENITVDAATYESSPIALLDRYLNEAIKNRLLGQKEVGMLLSGGLDSSLIYNMIRESGTNIRAFHTENGERAYAEMLVASSGGSLTAIPESSSSDMEAIMAHQSPVDLGSVVPQFNLGRSLKAAGLNVCLTGDGADELFGGYRRSLDYDSQASDVFCELPFYHNPRLDRTMMASTVELRSPFLSPAVVRLATQLRRSDRTGKKILKSLARKYGVPQDIIYRPKLALKTESIRQSLLANTKKNWELFELAGMYKPNPGGKFRVN